MDQDTLPLEEPPEKATVVLQLPITADQRKLLRDLQAAQGAEEKLEGMAAAHRAAPDLWRQAARFAIELLAASGREFTAEDVREITGDPPGHPNAMGHPFHEAARDGVIEKVRYQPSTRRTLHRHPIAVWRGTAKATHIAGSAT